MSTEISVVIPTRNEERVIEATLRQFQTLKQRHGLEIIVSDGGSDDATVAIAGRYADKLVAQPRQKTIAVGRNAGALAATGDLLFHTDADVRIPHPENFFRKILAAFADESVVAVTCGLRIYKEEELLRDRFWHWWMNNAVRWAIPFGARKGKGECQIVRRSAFEEIGGYEEWIVAGEDCDLFERLARIGTVRYLSDLEVEHSPRRFRKIGYCRLIFLIYLRESLSLLLRKRSHLDEWHPIR